MIHITSADDTQMNEVIEKAIKEKPQFLKYADHTLMLSDVRSLESLLETYTFTADKFIEPDGSVTLFLNELNLVENAKTEDEAKKCLANSILEYAEDFYNGFSYWDSAPNLQSHIPYVFKALIINDAVRIGESVQFNN